MMVIGSLSFLEMLDQIVAGVLIPIGALCIAISFGWFMFKADNPKDFFSFKYLGNKLKEEGLDLGRLQYVFAFMIKYLSPLLILGIDILGISENIFPNHIFSSNGLIVEIIGLAVIGLLIGIFFIFLKNKSLGDNQCEETEE